MRMSINQEQIINQGNTCVDTTSLEEWYQQYFGKKGEVTEHFKTLGSLPPEEKKSQGLLLSAIKTAGEKLYNDKKTFFRKKEIEEGLKKEIVDRSLPGIQQPQGHYALITKIRRRTEEILHHLGFIVTDGNNIVTKFDNFMSLNIPESHPATEMHDTFYLNQKDSSGKPLLLRTHMTAMQNELIKKHGYPLRTAMIGKVYRYENSDASHDCMFWQIDGCVIDKNMNMAYCKSLLQHLVSELFQKEVTMRMRPAFFPFVEPGFEIDASCVICEGKGCSLCKHTGRLELLGAGMIHPNVLAQAGVPDEYNGFAFGMGLNRIVGLTYGVKDIRFFTNGDLSFIRSF